MKQRVQKILARAGIASRRKAEDIILQGRVKINGDIAKLGVSADLSCDIIEVDGFSVDLPENKVYIALNKPSGCITSSTDPEGRPTVMRYVAGIAERIFSVGRLDYDTEGLLLLTNDGDFSQILQHPSNGIARKYHVKVKSIPTKNMLHKLRQGVIMHGSVKCKARVRLIKTTPKKNAWIEVILMEGRNRQIKIMFDSIGHRVLRILRTEFGPIHLDNLPSGSYRFLTKAEIRSITSLSG